MGDRKVVNQYIPPDFDPKLIPKGKKLSAKDGTVPVRMMLPFSMQCSTCNEFLYQGRKFNSKKEHVKGANAKYLGIQRYRFYIKCPGCAKHISFLTDPKNADYEMEAGATRNFEYTKDKQHQEEDLEQHQNHEEAQDPMKALENRVVESQREMAEMNRLEEIRAMNARHKKINDPDAVLQTLQAQETAKDESHQLLTADDEALIQSIQFGAREKSGTPKKNQKEETAIRRLDDTDERALEERRRQEVQYLERQQWQQTRKRAPKNTQKLPIVRNVKRRAAARTEGDATAPKKAAIADTTMPSKGALAGLLGGYSSDSDSE